VAGAQARAAAEQAAEQLGAMHAAADAAQRRFEDQLQAAEVAAGEERREMLAMAEELHTRMQVWPHALSGDALSGDATGWGSPCSLAMQSQAL
jgi:hypothetical protein